ncbi:MAG: nucleotide sugar dehydrogenase [Candidatus Harrisonbacteria bacterium]|nr:nucleotide sugar dehydrogenase [Candidatus Harrisonbacteria bacterium]
MSSFFDALKKKETAISVVGLGYVGLPIALELGRHFSVIGFDHSPERVELMKKGIDPSKELGKESFEGSDIEFTATPEDLKKASFHIVAVPTPIDENNLPDISLLLRACESVGKALKKGSYVVFESTVYPGCTEEDCVPVLEKYSGLQYKKDFKVGYSPERMNPGDKEHGIKEIVKVVSGCDEESLQSIASVYETIIKAGVYKASSIKVAEAAKIIENTQRDVNIALMNELSSIFEVMGINTFEVLEAAGTKWNFLRFHPGLVGGHCIGVDPYYLTYKAKELGRKTNMITSGRAVNDSMASYVAEQIRKKLGKGRILIMGVTFKENVSDIRNSKVADLYHDLLSFGFTVDVIDSYADSQEVEKEYGFPLIEKAEKGSYDGVVLAVTHREYKDLSEEYFCSLMKNEQGLFADLRALYRGKITRCDYWSL